MNETLAPSAIIQKLLDWGAAHVWNVNTLIELSLIAGIFVVASIVSRLLYDRITKAIDAAGLPLRTKRIARLSRRLIMPAAGLVIMFITANILNAEWLHMNTPLMFAVMKVLMAWIIIRLCLQIVDNTVIRNIFFWVIWLVAALSIFGILDQTATVLDSFAFTLGSFRVSLLEIIKSVLMLIFLLYLALFVSTFFERKVLKSKHLTRSSQVLIAKSIRVTLVIISIVIGVTSAGIDLSIFAVFSGAIGLGIGFGLQKSVSNLFSGFLLLMDKSIKPGDVIELDKEGTYGWVNEMAARYVEVVTRDNKSFLIPNEDFITQRVVNWSHGNSLIRLEAFFGVHYDSDPREVIRIALEVTEKLKGQRIVQEPEPLCYLRGFGESSLDFTMRFWITDAEHGITNVKGQVLLGLWDAFKANGIKIPYPHREIYTRDVK